MSDDSDDEVDCDLETYNAEAMATATVHSSRFGETVDQSNDMQEITDIDFHELDLP